jgi:ABC-2 type transport system ATP-binding protein
LSYSIETSNLTKRFPVIRGYLDMLLRPFRKKEVTALKDVNLQVKKGELFGLLGPNGAGKTTLIKILCTLILPTSGKAYVNGLEVTVDGKKIRKTIGYVVSDERSFYWRLTGRQNLRFFAQLNNLSNREGERRIKRLLNFMGLTADAERMVKDYSTGMRQKLAIARGLLTDPDIIFMDEPTKGLDPLISQSLRRLVREKLVEEEKRTVVFATHNLSEAEEMCDRIAIIDKGEVKKAGTVDEIKKGYHYEKEISLEEIFCEMQMDKKEEKIWFYR